MQEKKKSYYLSLDLMLFCLRHLCKTHFDTEFLFNIYTIRKKITRLGTFLCVIIKMSGTKSIIIKCAIVVRVVLFRSGQTIVLCNMLGLKTGRWPHPHSISCRWQSLKCLYQSWVSLGFILKENEQCCMCKCSCSATLFLWILARLLWSQAANAATIVWPMMPLGNT